MKATLLTFFCLLLMVLTEAQVLNIERERIRTDTTGWSGTGKASVNLISNTRKFLETGLNLHFQYKTERSLYLALSDYEVIKSEENDFSNKGMQHFRYNYKLGKIHTFEAFTQAQFNKVLNLNFRGLAGTGLRSKILGYDNFRLYTGLAYMFEYEESKINELKEYNNRFSSYLSLTFKISDNLTIINTTYYQPRIDYFKDYRLSNNLDVIFRISKRLSYVLKYEHITDNQPLPEMPRVTYNLKNTLLFDFGK